MNIINEKYNPLLKRKEILFGLESPSCPTNNEVKKKISEKLKISEDNIVVKKIYNKYGSLNFLVDVFIYDSNDIKLAIEPKVKEKSKSAK